MKERVTIALKGACMGFADAIPGVSGGTMALILGIYSRFVGAISSLGPATIPMLFKGKLNPSFIQPDVLHIMAVGLVFVILMYGLLHRHKKSMFMFF